MTRHSLVFPLRSGFLYLSFLVKYRCEYITPKIVNFSLLSSLSRFPRTEPRQRTKGSFLPQIRGKRKVALATENHSVVLLGYLLETLKKASSVKEVKRKS